MSNRTKSIILTVAVLLIICLAATLLLPKIVQVIPGSVKVRLENVPVANDIIQLVTTPLPDVLPTPGGVVSRPTVSLPENIGTLLEPTLTPMPQPTATPNLLPIETPKQTNTPTVTPAPTSSATPSPTATSLPESIRLEGMTAIPQSFNNCGPANLTQVLNFYDNSVSQTNVAAYLKPNAEDRNVSPWQIGDYVNGYTNLKIVYRSNGTLNMLRHFLATGYPVVIEKGYEPDTATAQGWFGHYLTVFGYDDSKEQFYTQDTYLGPFDGQGRVETYEYIEKFWQHFNYTFYVVYRPEQEAEVFSILGPELLDDRRMWEAGAARARVAIEANPENTFAWFNLGTNLAELGNMTGGAEYYQGAAEAYDQARIIGLPPRMLWYQFRIYLAYIKTGRHEDVITLTDTILSNEGGRYVEETYYYRGWALLYVDFSAAITNLELALERNPNFYYAQQLLDSFEQ